MPFPAGCYPKSQKPLSVPFVGPLDAYTDGLAGVWSVARRLLSSYTGPLIRIRRSSDDEEQDIGFDENGYLDIDALMAFVGSDSAFVVRVYDQSGLGRDLIQASATAQRRIVNAGTLDTVGITSGMVATANDTQGYSTDTFNTYDGSVMAVFVRGVVVSSAYTNSRVVGLTKDSGNDYSLPNIVAIDGNGIGGSVRAETYGGGSPGPLATATVTLGSQYVAASLCDGSTHTMKQGASSNSVAFTEALSINRVLAAGKYSGGASFTAAAGDAWAEAAVYFADKTADEAAIRTALTP